jgi:hypothetical protein
MVKDFFFYFRTSNFAQLGKNLIYTLNLIEFVRSHFYSIVELSGRNKFPNYVNWFITLITIIYKCYLITADETKYRIQFLLVNFLRHSPIERKKKRERDIVMGPFNKSHQHINDLISEHSNSKVVKQGNEFIPSIMSSSGSQRTSSVS